MIDAADRAMLERLFGPELPEGILGELKATPAMGVDCLGPDMPNAGVEVLIGGIIANGLGGRVPLGWTLTKKDDDRVLLQVCVASDR